MPPAPTIQGMDFINNEYFDTDTLDNILLLSLIKRNYAGCDNLIVCLEELWNKYGGRGHGIEIVALVQDEASKLWLESEDVTFRGIFSPTIWDQYKALDAATENEIPHSYIIDRDMNIRNTSILDLFQVIESNAIKDLDSTNQGVIPKLTYYWIFGLRTISKVFQEVNDIVLEFFTILS